MTYRGTTNRNARGGSQQRRRRREWLVATFRADVDVLRVTRETSYGLSTFYIEDGAVSTASNMPCRVDVFLREDDLVERLPACRCFRCGALLTVDTVSPDRIKPGCKGGTYRRDNIRPACSDCQSTTGGILGNAQKKAKAKPKKVSA